MAWPGTMKKKGNKIRTKKLKKKKQKQYRLVKYWLKTLIVNFIESVRLNSIADRVDSEMRNPSYNNEDIANRQLTPYDLLDIGNWSGQLFGEPSTQWKIWAPCSGPAISPIVVSITSAAWSACSGWFLPQQALVRCQQVSRRRASRDATTSSSTPAPSSELEALCSRRLSMCPSSKSTATTPASSTERSASRIALAKPSTNCTTGPRGTPSRWALGAWSTSIGHLGRSWSPTASSSTSTSRTTTHFGHGGTPQVACGVVAWNSADYNSIITAEVKQYGHEGSNAVLVKYAVLTDAVVANVREDNGGGWRRMVCPAHLR